MESLSKYAGVLSHKKLPEWFRPLILGLYCKLFNVNMSEAKNSDLKSYQSLNEFFRRKLKPEVRPIDVQAELGIILIHFMTVLYTRWRQQVWWIFVIFVNMMISVNSVIYENLAIL